jgi:hypothetical protein
VDNGWLHQMRLVTSSPGRATRLLMAGRQAAARDVAGPALHTIEARRLGTPAKAREAASAKAAAGAAEMLPSSHALEQEANDGEVGLAVTLCIRVLAGLVFYLFLSLLPMGKPHFSRKGC